MANRREERPSAAAALTPVQSMMPSSLMTDVQACLTRFERKRDESNEAIQQYRAVFERRKEELIKESIRNPEARASLFADFEKACSHDHALLDGRIKELEAVWMSCVYFRRLIQEWQVEAGIITDPNSDTLPE
jgi:hypothetical protein